MGTQKKIHHHGRADRNLSPSSRKSEISGLHLTRTVKQRSVCGDRYCCYDLAGTRRDMIHFVDRTELPSLDNVHFLLLLFLWHWLCRFFVNRRRTGAGHVLALLVLLLDSHNPLHLERCPKF